MNRTRTILLITIAFVCSEIYAGSPNHVSNFINHTGWNFVENKGQLASLDIRYYGHQGGISVYCKPGIISFVFTKKEKESDQISEATSLPEGILLPKGAGGFGRDKHQQSKTTVNRADLTLLNSSLSAQIVATDQQQYYENFYTTRNADSGITNIHTYKTITYKSIYPNIDLVLHSKENGMKYEFVIYPGGKVSDIQMQWNGPEGIKKLKDSKIEYSLALGTFTESSPYTFIQGAPFVPESACPSSTKIPSSFILKNNRVSFKTGKYDKTKTLVIDPTLIWGTYFGGSGYDGGSAIATDDSGNVYITGGTNSVSGIATNGTFQTSFAGGSTYGGDAFLAKFNGAGVRQWSTYYGGDAIESGDGIAIDNSGNVYITGTTTSSNGIATNGSYQTFLAGTQDAFLAKFSSSGGLNWATYYGGGGTTLLGPATNSGYGVAIDISGNVYITGTTNSDYGIATSGAYRTSVIELTDAFLAKFNGNGKIQWGTYYGGTENDGSLGVATDDLGDVYITGVTASPTGIATNGAYQTSYYSGTEEAFLAKFTDNGTLQWATYYGVHGEVLGYGVATDGSGNVYITGTSYGSTSLVTTSGAYQTSFGGGGSDAFLAKFDSSGKTQWATYYGGSSSDEGAAIATDASGNVYIIGTTQSNSGIATADGYQTIYTGSSDAFLAIFNGAGVRQWATYYGGNDGSGYGVAVDKLGSVYITGSTFSSLNIATSGAYQTYIGGLEDAFLAKFAKVDNDAGIDSFITPVGSFCDDTVPVIVRLKNYNPNELDSVKIGLSINGKLYGRYSWIGNLFKDSTMNVNLGSIIFPPGSDTIKVWTYDPNGGIDSFSGNDTSTSFINVRPLPSANAGPDTTLCYNETYTMQGSGGVTYTWHPAIYLSSATDPNALAILPNTERYVLVVGNSFGCSDSSPVLLKVRQKLKVQAAVSSISVCYGQTIKLSAKGTGGDSLNYKYEWDNGLNGDSVIEKVYKSAWYKVVLQDNCSPTPGTDSVFVTVIPATKADFSWHPTQKLEPGQDINFFNQSSTASKYLWTFGTNDSSRIVSPVYFYKNSGEYKIMLVAYGSGTCQNDTAYENIIIGEQVIVFIPNAFSPNSDGINDVFDISGTGIKSYTFNIYDRWGEQLFEATPGHTGWDGTFKGAQVPESIYIYQLDVTDIEGQHHYLSGNITLMR